MISSLSTVTTEEAAAYMREAFDDEIAAAHQLACDRNRLDGDAAVPDDAEVHHALFMLRRVTGGSAPSFDGFRAELRQRAKALKEIFKADERVAA